MSIQDIEKQRLKDWFWNKHDWNCYKQAEKELTEKKKNQSWWKRNTTSESERQFLIKRTKQILNKKWEDALRGK